MARKPQTKPPAVAEAQPVAVKREPKVIRYTAELADEICWRISQGATFGSLAKEDGMPGERTFFDWLQRHDDFAEMYSRAREARADYRAELIDQITKGALAGKVDPNTARVAIDGQRFLASRENPKRYGERLDLNVKSDDSDLTEDAMNERLIKLAQKHGLRQAPQITEE